MKSPECVCKTSEEYIRVALALETLAYHDKNYLDSTFAYINGKQKYIGAYRTLADAVKARDIAEGSIHDGEGGND